jgi:heptaprenyl diphosphate synthase
MTGDGQAATEAVLTEALDGVPGSLREQCRRLVAADGKRLRAGLVLAVAGRAWPGTSRRTATAAAAVELLHLATHDPVRREAPLVGTVLFAVANRLAADVGAGALLADALLDVCAGQTLDTGDPLRIGELSTGTLLATACRLGAIVTGSPQDGLQEYGTAFGVAVHLLDNARAVASHIGVPETLAMVDEHVERAATACPDLAGLPRRYRDSQLPLMLPRYPTVLSS